MHKKILSLIVALFLVITAFLPFTKALGQGLVEYAIILVVVAFNKDESVEFNYLPNSPGQAKPQNPIRPGEVIIYSYVVTNTSDPTCTQTIQSQVETTSGLNSMRVAMSDNHLIVNGQEVGNLDQCFYNVDRFSIAVGVPVPPGVDLTALLAVHPPLPQFLNVTIVDSNQGTRAASSTIPAGPPLFFPIINTD